MSNDPWGDHLESCPQCRENPGSPCGVGKALVERELRAYEQERDRKFDKWEERKDKGS